jgi:hypothetical protein
MKVYYKEISLSDGFEISNKDKNSRIVAGKEAGLCSGFKLFNSLKDRPITCWKCICTADRWILDKHLTCSRPPVLNLYALVRLPGTKKRAEVSRLVMMTRDHIIPKSLGGKDCIENLRPGCEVCNMGRGSIMNKEDVQFMAAHPELISAERAAIAAAKRHKHEQLLALRAEQNDE